MRDVGATVVADVPDGSDKNNANKFTTKKLRGQFMSIENEPKDK